MNDGENPNACDANDNTAAGCFIQVEKAPRVAARRLIGLRDLLKLMDGVIHNPVFGNDYVASIDDLYFRIRFNSDSDGESLSGRIQTVMCDDKPREYVSIRPNSWRLMHELHFGACVVRLGIGWNEFGGKVSMKRGMLQFNPNKSGSDARLGRFLQKVGGYCRSVELARYDMAFDMPIERHRVWMPKDRRHLELRITDAITEYLGEREKAGRVKLYDKSAEMKLKSGVPITRLELTVDANWDVEQVLKHLPPVYALGIATKIDVLDGCKPLVKDFALLARAYVETTGRPIDQFLTGIRWDVKRKIIDSLSVPAIEIDGEVIESLMVDAFFWEEEFSR